MEEIKIGEYVRFKDGKIRKIIGQDKDNHLIVDIFIYGGNWLTFNEKDNIVKHNPNIIDLIEVGDYVNGRKVRKTFIDPFTKKKRLEIEGTVINWQGDRSYIYCEAEDIKSIVTKEAFKNAEYRLED